MDVPAELPVPLRPVVKLPVLPDVDGLVWNRPPVELPPESPEVPAGLLPFLLVKLPDRSDVDGFWALLPDEVPLV
jgi:hypothetical protein